MRKILAWLPILLCLVLLSGCQLPRVFIPRALRSTASSATLAPTSQATPAPGASLVLSAKTIHEESKSPGYTLDARWPRLEWGHDARASAFNQAAEAFATDAVSGFKKDVAGLPTDPAFQDTSSFLKIDFTTPQTTGGILSTLFEMSFYYAGAAHPGHSSHAINYDLRTGKVLALADLFQPKAAYLDTLSSLCIQDLKARKALEWPDGAAPKADNFQVWNFTPGGLQITFDEYQVASYAAGPQTVVIPYDKLKGILRADGPAAAFLSH